jgi:large subunit ribosomal protein L11
MAKVLHKLIKLQIKAGAANPAPPVGPALGQAGLNIMQFCKAFNAETKDKSGVIPVVIRAYKDKTFEFVCKEPPISSLIKEAIGLAKGSDKPHLNKVGSLSIQQVEKIALRKAPDLRFFTKKAAMKMVMGTARSMGVTTTGSLDEVSDE